MILKNIFKVKIHPFFYIFLFISVFTGNFYDYIIFTSILIIHEFGHILGGLFFSWEIDRIIILPFGGLTVFNILLNTSLFEQFIVTILGPVFQIIYFFFLYRFFSLSNSLIYYNFILLFFNLLPIYPLDGSKFLYIFLCIIFPFKFAYLLLFIISFVTIFLCIFLLRRFDLLIYLIFFFLIVRCFIAVFDRNNVFYKFLFERYLYNFDFKRVKVISDVCGMYLWCIHIFSFKKNVSERDFLLKMFDKSGHLW